MSRGRFCLKLLPDYKLTTPEFIEVKLIFLERYVLYDNTF